MTRASKARFDLREVAVALFQYEGIQEGRWQLSVDFSLARALIGPDDQGALPGAMLAVRGLVLERNDAAPEGTPMMFDASKENPL